MSKNTSISLGSYFDQFIQNQVSEGRYKNVSEVVRAGLRLLENEENKVTGLNSPKVESFDFDGHLAKLKANKAKMAKLTFRQEATDDSFTI